MTVVGAVRPRASPPAERSPAAGLTASEARERLARFGPNVLAESAGPRWWLRFVQNLVHLFALLLWAGAGLAAIGGMPQLAIAIVVVILVNAVFSFAQEHRAERAVEALSRVLPQRARVRRDGRPQEVDARALVPGDLMLLAPGERISADARLLSAVELRVDMSTLTGESRPVLRHSVANGGGGGLEAPERVFAGTHVFSGSAEAVVTATGMETELGRIAGLTQGAERRPSPLELEMRRVTGVVALLTLARKAGVDPVTDAHRFPRRGEVPFDSRRKRMTTVHDTPDGRVAYVKGAPALVVARTTLSEDARARVLAVARRVVDPGTPVSEAIEDDLDLLGLIGMQDPPRPEVAAAVRSCREAGIRVVMVTGDHAITAEAIARRIGLITRRARILQGDEIDTLDDAALIAALAGPDALVARVTPEQKLRIAAALHDAGEIVAMTGDGVNDAPALRTADIGIAMGKSGTDVAREAADMVLTDDNFASIAAAVEEGRAVYVFCFRIGRRRCAPATSSSRCASRAASTRCTTS